MKAPIGDQAYTLVSLVNKEDAPVQLSPYVWKTIIELRYVAPVFSCSTFAWGRRCPGPGYVGAY
jgi:hypothetical protein